MTADVDATIYDLDGTLARLIVNWKTVAQELQDYFDEAGLAEAVTSVWDAYDRVQGTDHAGAVEEIIARHERDGASRSRRLAHADRLLNQAQPIGVCSLNSERACRIALDRHDLADRVETIVGRDTVPERKPDPEPLLAAARALDVPVERILFVGDSRRDEVAAERAGMPFEYVGTAPGEE